MNTVVLGLFVGLAAAFISVILVKIVRARVSLSFLSDHQNVAGIFINVLSLIYGILIAFVIFVVWSDYQDAKVQVVHEANSLNDACRISDALPPEIRKTIYSAAAVYGRSVIRSEWPSMDRHESDGQTQEALDAMWRVALGIQVRDDRDQVLYQELLERVTDVGNSRRLRIHLCQDRVPALMWVLLWSGALITIAFSLFLGSRSILTHIFMTGALTLEIALLLFLIAALDNPFGGDIAVSPQPMQSVLTRLESLK